MNKTPVLNKINLSIKPRSLNAVIGTIGCGKSSLFMALLREVPITVGELQVGEDIAYVEQDPVVFKDYSCYWNEQEKENETPVLNKINLSIKPRSLIVVTVSVKEVISITCGIIKHVLCDR